MIIDSHEHLMLPIEMQIEKLNQAGVDKAILFSTVPHPERAKNLAELRGEMNILYRVLAGANNKEANRERMIKNNNELAMQMKKYPERFFGFGAVPLGMSEPETSSWIEENILSNEFKGIGEFTPGSDEQIRQLEVIFQAVNNFSNLPIWVHTFNPVTISGIHILMELCEKYPSVPVIFGHMGGSNWIDVIDFAKSHKYVYLDLSAAFASIATRIAISELPERCLYSSDAPYGEPYLYRQLIEFVSPSQEVANMVLGNNILQLLSE
ncbi:MAG: amidohydrolase family protein [Lachnospiraceae bacterium]|nr:amidohydrolase family protein [Lachnospiraceae bacterium]